MGEPIAHDPQTTDEIREAFHLFDHNRDGSITMEELGNVMNVLGQAFTERELAETLKLVDDDGNGTIELEEFKRVMTHEESRMIAWGQGDEEIKRAFLAFDQDQNGFISYEELFHVFRRLGEMPSKEEVLEMIKHADKDGDGRLSYSEFSHMMMMEDYDDGYHLGPDSNVQHSTLEEGLFHD